MLNLNLPNYVLDQRSLAASSWSPKRVVRTLQITQNSVNITADFPSGPDLIRLDELWLFHHFNAIATPDGTATVSNIAAQFFINGSPSAAFLDRPLFTGAVGVAQQLVGPSWRNPIIVAQGEFLRLGAVFNIAAANNTVQFSVGAVVIPRANMQVS